MPDLGKLLLWTESLLYYFPSLKHVENHASEPPASDDFLQFFTKNNVCHIMQIM